MWIRSQSKYSLINTNAIRICEDDRDDCCDYLICGYQDGYDHELGVYSSFEKATKVLDEIQKLIANDITYDIKKTREVRYCGNKYNMIYQMPKDDDVEV